MTRFFGLLLAIKLLKMKAQVKQRIRSVNKIFLHMLKISNQQYGLHKPTEKKVFLGYYRLSVAGCFKAGYKFVSFTGAINISKLFPVKNEDTTIIDESRHIFDQ
jgi:hypothetical protein